LRRRRRWWCCVISSPCPLLSFGLLLLLSLLLSHYFSNLSYFFRSSKLYPFCFCSLSSLSLFFSFPLVRLLLWLLYLEDAGIFGKPACITVARDVSRDTRPIDLRIAPLSLLTSLSIIVTDSQLFEDSECWKRRRLGSSDLAIEVFTVL